MNLNRSRQFFDAMKVRDTDFLVLSEDFNKRLPS